MSRKYLILFIILSLFGLCLGLASRTSSVAAFDLSFSTTLQHSQPSWFVIFNFAVSLFDFILPLFTLPLFIRFLIKKDYPSALILLLASFSWSIVRILKMSFGVICPNPPQVQALYPFAAHRDQSFLLPSFIPALRQFFRLPTCYPSGHVFDYISVFGTLAFLRNRITPSPPIRQTIYYLSLFLVATVGIGRVSLGAHWFTDVIGGYFLGFAWLYLLKFTHQKLQTV